MQPVYTTRFARSMRHLSSSMWGFMLRFCEKRYLKDINPNYIYWEMLHLPIFSNNKFVYIVILLLPSV